MALTLAITLLPLIVLLGWRLRIAGEIRESIASLEANGLPVTFAQLSERNPAPDAPRYATDVYLEAVKAYVDLAPPVVANLPFEHEPLGAPQAPLRPEMLEAIRACVDANEKTLTLLHRAASLPEGRYVLAYGPRPDMTHLPRLRPLVPLLCCQALRQIDDGAVAGAVQSTMDALALCQSLSHDGYFISLRQQWEMEERIIQVLERMLWRIAPEALDVTPFQQYFTLKRRLAQIQNVAEVEQGLFIARIREGRQRSLFKQAILSAGVGDLNLRAYLDISALARQWPGETLGGREVVERKYAERWERISDHPLLYVTLLRYPPPGDWQYFQTELDRISVVEAAQAAHRFRRATGQWPENTSQLLAHDEDAASTRIDGAEVVVLERKEDNLILHNGREAGERVSFQLRMLH